MYERRRTPRPAPRALIGCDERTAATPAGRLLARIPWERPATGPNVAPASRFLAALLG